MARKLVAPINPVMGVKAVKGELPKARRGDQARTMRYATAMAEVRRKVGPGTWASIATFGAAAGAAGVRRHILRGDRPIDGRLSEWDIEARRVYGEDGQATGSELFVRLKAPRAKSTPKAKK